MTTAKPPVGQRERARQVADDIRHLADCGVPIHDIAKRVGRTEKYIRQQLVGTRRPGWRAQQRQAQEGSRMTTPTRPSHAWEVDAVCAQTDPDLWFPAIGESALVARRLCLTCPVRAECLDAAMAEEAGQVRHGIRGGLTARERHALATKQRQAAA